MVNLMTKNNRSDRNVLATESDRLQAIWDLCQKDFTCYAAMLYGWELFDFQKEICSFLQNLEATFDGRAILTLPTRHGKTDLSIAFASWCLGRGYTRGADGNFLGSVRRVIYASASDEFATRQTSALRDKFAEGQQARYIFPACILDPKGSAAGQWRFKGVPANWSTCVAAGVGSQLSGVGADLTIADDLIKDYEEANSANARDRVWNWLGTVALQRSLAGGRFLLIGSRWHSEDPAGRFLASNANGMWKVLHKPAVIDIDTPQARALCPQLRSLAWWLDFREKWGPATFNATAQGDPTPDKGEVWERDWFEQSRYEIGASPKPEDCETWLTIDSAEGLGKKHDYCGYCRSGRDKNGEIWIFNTGKVKCTQNELAELIADISEGGKCGVAIEAGARCEWLSQLLGTLGIVPVKLSPGIASKIDRAKTVRFLAQTGRVHVCRDGSGEELIRTCCAFPKDKHDDQHDAFVWSLFKMRDSGKFFVMSI
jgi:predicted phage terminase large subunit-like protein